MTEPQQDLVGRTVAGKYKVLRVIGRGGMGAVYEAENLGIGKKVALKFVDAEFAKDEQVVSRFAREARVASSIESAHIVTVFDAGTEDGQPYLVMELLRGEDLGTRLRRLGRLPVSDAMHILAQVLRGLARAHQAGIVHRDLKPDNIFLVHSEGDALFAKIVDFGVSKIRKAQSGTAPLALTGKGTVLGTPLYMSPEQAQASPDLDGRADLYGAGAILFECLGGRPPHTGESYEQIILAICMRDAPDLRAIDPAIGEPVAAFVAKALARDRAARFQSAAEMLAGLHEVAPEERTRVPLDSLPSATLLSAQASGERQGAGPPTDVSWSRGSPPARAATQDDPVRPTFLSRALVPLIAFAATLAGVVVTLSIVTSMQKRDTAQPPAAATTGERMASPPPEPAQAARDASVAAPPPVASAPPPASPPEPIVATATSAPTNPARPAPASRPPAARPSAPAQPQPQKPALDIAREL
jgi:eukaryotic-like serine/threonine-protein kinase